MSATWLLSAVVLLAMTPHQTKSQGNLSSVKLGTLPVIAGVTFEARIHGTCSWVCVHTAHEHGLVTGHDKRVV